MADGLHRVLSGRAAEPAGPRRWWKPCGILVLLLLLAPFVAWFLLSFLVRAWLSGSGFLSGGYFLAILTTWKTLVLAALVLLGGVLFSLLRRSAAAAGVRSVPFTLAAFAGLVVACVVVANWTLQTKTDLGDTPSANRWGFWRVFAPSESKRHVSNNGEVTFLEVTTNAQSYRDDEWTIPPTDADENRVLLVGDSVVMGFSISYAKDLLDKLLEQRLNAASDTRWDVWNIANTPSSLWYFSEALMRIGRDAKPRYAVMVFYCNNDLTIFDEQIILADKPDWFQSVARNLGVYQDLLVMSSNPWPFSHEPDDDGLAELLAHFDRLIAFCKENDIQLVVWDATGPCPVFEPYRGREGLTFLSWRTDVGQGCGDNPDMCLFFEDPELGHPSGHLTPKGNARVADLIAPVLLELEARRRADAAQNP